MHNDLRGEETIKLGAKTYLLKFNNDAVRRLELVMGGQRLHFLMANIEQYGSLELVQNAIMAGLAYNPAYKMTARKLIGLLDPSQTDVYLTTIARTYIQWRGFDPDKLVAGLDDGNTEDSSTLPLEPSEGDE